MNRVLSHLDLLYMPKTDKTEIISRYYNDPLVGYFKIIKT